MNFQKMNQNIDLTKLLIKGIRIILSVIMVIILVIIALGGIKLISDIGLLLHEKMETVLKELMISIFLILAIVELFNITLAYVQKGRVKVTFIVDATLVVMLAEVMSSWFKEESFTKMATLSMLILVLGFMRFLAIRFSPKHEE